MPKKQYSKPMRGKSQGKSPEQLDRLENLFAQIEEGHGQKGDEVPETEEKEEKETPEGSVQEEEKLEPEQETPDATEKPAQHQERVKRSRQAKSGRGDGQKSNLP